MLELKARTVYVCFKQIGRQKSQVEKNLNMNLKNNKTRARSLD